MASEKTYIEPADEEGEEPKYESPIKKPLCDKPDSLIREMVYLAEAQEHWRRIVRWSEGVMTYGASKVCHFARKALQVCDTRLYEASRALARQGFRPCHKCGGSGVLSYADATLAACRCYECGGKGYVKKED